MHFTQAGITYHSPRFSNFTCVRRNVERIPSRPCAQARWLMRNKFCVWDTETTGLEDDAKIVSIGIVDQDGQILLDTLINPGVPIPEEATDIHGVTDDMVADAPTFDQVYTQIKDVLERSIWAIYNKAYDIPRLNYECERYYLPPIAPAQHRQTEQRYDRFFSFSNYSVGQTVCIMESFAEHYGQWHDYFQSYTWQRLSTATKYYRIKVSNAHNALADAISTLEVIRHMAFDEDKPQRRQSYEME